MSDRMRRVNESLRAVLSEAVGDLKDPRIGFVTITGVEATTDVKYATVYVSVYGDEDARGRTLDGLRSARALLQARVNRELHLKRTPVLTFEYDQTPEHGVRLTQLIDRLASDESPE